MRTRRLGYEPEELETDILIRKPVYLQGHPMRVTEFFSDLFVYGDEGREKLQSLASLNGWVVDLSGEWADIHWDLDAMSSDSEVLGAGLLRLEDELEDAWTYSTGILLDRVGTKHRGQGLGPFAVRGTLEYLILGTADTTLSLLHAVAQGFEDESSLEFQTANKKVMKSWSTTGYSRETPGSQVMWANVGELPSRDPSLHLTEPSCHCFPPSWSNRPIRSLLSWF